MTRAAIYARYSTDLQSDASIEDQHRLCARLIEANGWSESKTYADRGLSGATHLRPSYQHLLQDARDGAFDVVVAEGLDRLSRDQEHIAAFYKQMRFLGIPIVTVAEGEVPELHIGLKGTMSSLFLKDLAQKTRRGLEGRIRKGKSAGGITYGYDVVRQVLADGEMSTGERIINKAQAATVQGIFKDYANGLSPRAIASALNNDGIAGPRGTGWGSSTIYGNHKRGTGILNNELYIGRLVWNRQRFVKDPSTGKRQARMNPTEDWIIEEVPQLRFIDQDLWEAVKARQKATRNDMIRDGLNRPERAHRAKHLFSGMLICGACGGGYTIVGKTRYGCANTRNKGTCTNRLTIKREDLEARVLLGLKDQLLHPDLIAEFVSAFQAEFNRLANESSKTRSQTKQELTRVSKQIDKIIDAITEGMFHPSMKAKMDELEDRKLKLEAELATTEPDNPVMLHPGLAELYRAKVANLTESLNDASSKAEATTLIRSLLTEIRLIPDSDSLDIELVGELAGLLALGQTKTASEAFASGRSVTMVAGVGFEPTTFRL
ncbi:MULTISPECIES: recombinase family protein [Halocynthiibacter]|uniref:Recombinase family protein n=1 Tax=Halocynthiibacter halioticoli TaxID=2986804 RepID=A0AAE3J356_9RHOB|nr:MULTISPECIES: recombinase family protein [Halocynthiibacter]MCV6826085.1 recombinase family protein [Halocynthiibacter halioticoli]MCW4059086.1 recombinase family protein [Halocynthiibacter sp. SDUM655004]